MNLNKFIQTLKEFMSRKRSNAGLKTRFNPKYIRLIPQKDSEENAQTRKETVHKLIGVMFLSLSKRGRPKIETEEISNAA